MFKKCSKCKQEKEISEFHKDKFRKSGYTSECKVCRNQRKKEYRKTINGQIKTKNYRILYKIKHFEHLKQKEKEYREKNLKILSKKYNEYYHKNSLKINNQRKEREEFYFKKGNKVYFEGKLGKIIDRKYRKGCLVEFIDGFKFWIGIYKLKPFKKLSNMKCKI